MALDVCTITGTLYDIHGNATPGVAIRLRNIYVPAAIDVGSLVMGESSRIIADEDGVVSFTLIQGAQVRLEIPGREQEFVRTVTVPAEATADLVSLLYPNLVSVDWDDDSPIDTTNGEQFTLSATGTFSDGSTDDVTAACTFVIDDSDVLYNVSGSNFRAVGVGTATITLTAIDTSLLTLYQEPDGDLIERLDAPSYTLPAAFTVNVT